MSVGSIGVANAYLARSYQTAQADMATALARLGSNQRFQTASQDAGGYTRLARLQGSQGIYDAAYGSANKVAAEMEAFDGWATAMIDQLGQLAALDPSETDKIAGIEATIASLNLATYNGTAITSGDTASTMLELDGTATAAIDVDAVVVTGTKAWVIADLTAMTTFANDIALAKTQAESMAAAASAMNSSTQAAIQTITEIDAAAEMAKYTAADITQQSAVAVMAQGNNSARAILNLFR